MQQRRALLSVIIAILFLFAACPSGNAAEGQPLVTLKFSTLFPAMHKVALLKADYCKEIEKRTNGRVKIDFFPGAILTPPAQTYDNVLKGIADMGETFASYTMGRFPLTEVIDLPLGYTSATQGTRLANAFFKKFKPKEFDGVKVLWLHTAGPQDIFTKKPVTRLEDMKGLKIRSTGTSAAIVLALGAAPVGMSMGEAYDAIARGVANGVVAPVESIKGWKLGEVVSYGAVSDSRHTNAAIIIMNKNKWNALPPDIQKIIDQVSEEFVEKQARLWEDLDKEGLEFLNQKGGKLNVLSPQEDARWKTRLKPILDDYVARMKAKGLPGDEALKFCMEGLKAH